MSIPQRKSEAAFGDIFALSPLDPAAESAASSLGDDYDPEAAIAMLRHFRDDPTEDPEEQRRDFLALAQAIDEDRPLGMRLFDQYLCD